MLNLEISLKTQNVRSFNLSENGLYSMKKKVQAVMFEGDDMPHHMRSLPTQALVTQKAS